MKKIILKSTLVLVLMLSLIVPLIFMTGCRSSCICVTESQFSLSITVDTTTVNSGDYVTVTATFQNNSGRALRINYSGIFLMPIIDGIPQIFPGHSLIARRLETDEIIQKTWRERLWALDSIDLSFSAAFVLNRGRNSEHWIRVWSNIVEVTVV